MICEKCVNDADVIIIWHHLSIGKLKESLLCSGCCLTMKESEKYSINYYSEKLVVENRNRNIDKLSCEYLKFRKPEIFETG